MLLLLVEWGTGDQERKGSFEIAGIGYALVVMSS